MWPESHFHFCRVDQCHRRLFLQVISLFSATRSLRARRRTSDQRTDRSASAVGSLQHHGHRKMIKWTKVGECVGRRWGGGRCITVERRQVIGLSDTVTAGLAVCVADGNILAILLESREQPHGSAGNRPAAGLQWPNQRGFPHRTPITGYVRWP